MEDAQYCDCVLVNTTQRPMPEYRLQVYDAVFIGQVVKVELQDEVIWEDWTMRERVTELRVMKHWKGVSTEHLVIKSSGSNCDYVFRIGETYLVFAYETEDQTLKEASVLSADICDKEGTRLLEESYEQVKTLDALVEQK